ncbi:MAG: hypothetical protein K9J79_09445 [Desulfobacteraceae bacterium]|nr:hypothetical protein [Desulfobacteraceae bacterium]
MRAHRIFLFSLCFIAVNVMLCIPFIQTPGSAAQKPERKIVAAFKYPGLTVPSDGKLKADLVVKNKGLTDETVFLEVAEKPAGWEASFSTYNKTVSGVFVGEESKKSITFKARKKDADKKLPTGTYHFRIRAVTEDGLIEQSASLSVTVVEKETREKTIGLSTSYPMLQGPADTSFEFTINVSNNSAKAGLFNLQAKAPAKGWKTSFKPAYEDKQISSLNIKANKSKSVKVEITPPRQASTGTYPIDVRVWQGEIEATTTLKVKLTGTYNISCNTPKGLLSAEVEKGGDTTMSLLVKNTGSATQKKISFVSFKPEDWQVNFKPKTVTGIKPGEMKQVEVSIIPAEDALVGDYSVGVKAQGQKASDKVEFRITVKASAAWGWIGVGIIILVIVGLAITFRILGRR